MMARPAILAVCLAALWAAACATGPRKSPHERAEFHYKLADNAFYDHHITEAIEELYQALDLDPNYKEAHHLLGLIYFGRKDYAKAERHFLRALALDPRYFAARTNLGALYLAEERWEAAIEVLRPLLDEPLYPTPHILHNNLGWAYMHLGQTRKAEEHFKRAVFLKPKMCLAHKNLGLLYEQTGRPDLAVRAYDRAVRNCPKFQEPFYRLGHLYAQARQWRQARKAFERCRALAPDSMWGERCGQELVTLPPAAPLPRRAP